MEGICPGKNSEFFGKDANWAYLLRLVKTMHLIKKQNGAANHSKVSRVSFHFTRKDAPAGQSQYTLGFFGNGTDVGNPSVSGTKLFEDRIRLLRKETGERSLPASYVTKSASTIN